MANGGSGSKLTPLWLVLGGVVLTLAMMGAIVAIHPLDFSPPKPACEGEGCSGEHGATPEAKPGERPETSHATPPGEHAGAPAGETAPRRQ
jgi:hypothetical protein